MSNAPLHILQVNAAEYGGGAEVVARQLHHGLRSRGQRSWLMVGRGPATGPAVVGFPDDWTTRVLHLAAGGARLVERFRGMETYRYPATGRALQRHAHADVVHLHNLHGGYFDLRELPALSRRVPVVLTLHDAWLLSGHCAHSFQCERWRTGCGACPDLTIYPAVRRDATALNWERKQRILQQCRLFVATPSAWLANRVRESLLAPALAELRVIANGVDTALFAPGNRTAARTALGLPGDAPLALFVGGAAPSPFKDRSGAQAAAIRAGELLGRQVGLVVLGAPGMDVHGEHATILGRPFEPDARRLALYYQAADVYVHAARADTFPTTTLEAMAAGLPTVAAAVGGVPEQVRSLRSWAGSAAHGEDAATGILVPPGDGERMAGALAHLLADEPLRRRLGHNAARVARADHDAELQCDAYLRWYRALAGGTA